VHRREVRAVELGDAKIDAAAGGDPAARVGKRLGRTAQRGRRRVVVVDRPPPAARLDRDDRKRGAGRDVRGAPLDQRAQRRCRRRPCQRAQGAGHGERCGDRPHEDDPPAGGMGA
jgi:hypothetical protein